LFYNHAHVPAVGSDEGFYYTHLGAGPTPEKLRDMLEQRFSVKGKQLRLLEVSCTCASVL